MKPQIDNSDLGARMHAAFTTVASEGYSKVRTCIHMSLHQIAHCLERFSLDCPSPGRQ